MASRSAKYRQKLKEQNPEKYQVYLDKQKSISKHKRDTLKKEVAKKTPSSESLERKENQLKLQRARQEKYVAKKKSCPENKKKLTVKWTGIGRGVTRKCIKSKRDYQRLMKQKQRANQTPQKKTWERKKDRERKSLLALFNKSVSKEVENIIVDEEIDVIEEHEVENIPTVVDEELEDSVDEELDSVDEELEDSVDEELEDSVDEELEDSVDEELEDSVDEELDSVDEELEDSVDEELEDSVDEELEDSLDEELEDSVDEELEDSVDEDSVDEELEDSADEEIEDSVDEEMDLDRVIEENDVVIELKKTKVGKVALKEVAKSLAKKSSQRHLARKLKLHRKTIRNVGIGSYKRKSKVDESSIKDFYTREDISRVMPQKRYATKHGAGYLLQISLKAARSKYLKENPKKYVSLGKFAALRPKNVRLLQNNHREYCVCVYCVNVRYKLLTLSRAMKNTTKKKTNETDINDMLLCEKENMSSYHKRECISGECTKCSDHMETFQEYYKDIPEDQVLTWSRWERTLVHGRDKKVVITKSGNKTSILNEFVNKDIDKPAQGFSFIEHLHTAHWQIKQFNTIKNELPDGVTLQVMDFAKNRAVKYQDEIKSAFYTQEQITMHPIITYYSSSSGLVKNSAVVISEDNNHDYHAVEHFQKVVNDKIETEMHQKPTAKVIFSDGCSSQYKSKGPFADISLHNEINRNYFGSEHGKAEGDAEIGQLNKAIDRAIIGNQVVINHAEDLFNYCHKHLEIDQTLVKREYFFVRNGEINRKRPETEIKTVPNSRKIHQIISDSLLTLMTRNLSCFCRSCKLGEYESCCNKAYVNAYEKRNLKSEKPESVNAYRGGRVRTGRGEPGTRRGRQVRTRGGRGGRSSPTVGQGRKVVETPKRGQRVRVRGGRGGRSARRRRVSESSTSSGDDLPSSPGSVATPKRRRRRVLESSGDDQPSSPGIPGTGNPSSSDILGHMLFPVSDNPDASIEQPVAMDIDEWDPSVVDDILRELKYMDAESSYVSGSSNQTSPVIERQQSSIDHTTMTRVDLDINRDAHPPVDVEDAHPPGDVEDAHPPGDVEDAHPPRDVEIPEVLTSTDTGSARDAHPPVDVEDAHHPGDVEDAHPPGDVEDAHPPGDVEIPEVLTSTDTGSARDAHPPVDVEDAHPPGDVEDAHPPGDVEDAHPPGDVEDAHPPGDVEDAHPPGDVEIPEVLTSTDTGSARYNVGSHVSVQHGKHLLPAVVVEPPEDMCPSSTSGLWVQCYKKTRSSWMLEEKKFFFLFSDIITNIGTPSIHGAGSRFDFKFEIF